MRAAINIRLRTNLLYDERWIILDPASRGQYVMALMHAKLADCPTWNSAAHFAGIVGVDPARLIESGLLVLGADGSVSIDPEEWEFATRPLDPTNAERQKRHREKRAGQPSQHAGILPPTPSEWDDRPPRKVTA